ncbi:MAG TPA: glucose-6-phosphate dehydrogenase assembly protein OpcA, partial [Candidatus Dormibacteraeota bacterium]|nr:glucose-6-phosphate dehydrogenase assembly protein OpcA [Candidatus Dormibacteraeota bacterium]
GFDTLVIPLLIPHLQSFLWWLGDPDPADPALRSLVAICDRLIIDSAMGGPERLSPLSSALVAPAGGRGAVLGDMAWTRLEGYREALARIFDEGGRQRYLDGLAEVELTTPRRARDPLGSSELLLAGWLASRLGYSRPMPAPGGVSLETAGGARVGFHFAASRRASDLPIVGVRIAGRAGRRQLEVTLTEERGAWTLRTEETGVEPQHRRLPLAPLDQTEALSRELARMGRDRVYEDALQLAARIEAVLPAGGGRSPG